MTGFLDHLPTRPPAPLTLVAFQMKLLTELGLKPDLAKGDLSAGARKVLETATMADWSTLSRIKLAEVQAQEIGRFLKGFLVYHLGNLPSR